MVAVVVAVDVPVLVKVEVAVDVAVVVVVAEVVPVDVGEVVGDEVIDVVVVPDVVPVEVRVVDGDVVAVVVSVVLGEEVAVVVAVVVGVVSWHVLNSPPKMYDVAAFDNVAASLSHTDWSAIFTSPVGVHSNAFLLHCPFSGAPSNSPTAAFKASTAAKQSSVLDPRSNANPMPPRTFGSQCNPSCGSS